MHIIKELLDLLFVVSACVRRVRVCMSDDVRPTQSTDDIIHGMARSRNVTRMGFATIATTTVDR